MKYRWNTDVHEYILNKKISKNSLSKYNINLVCKLQIFLILTFYGGSSDYLKVH